jgi:PAS domain-containing protein
MEYSSGSSMHKNWFECKATRIVEGGTVRILIAHEDITERKRAEWRIQFQAHLLASVEQAVIATGLGGKIIYWNRFADTIARLGGDEFTVIMGELEDYESVERVAREILAKLAEPFRRETGNIYESASIGITLYPDDATSMEALLKNADQAMYAAKGQGRNRYNYYTPSMQRAA